MMMKNRRRQIFDILSVLAFALLLGGCGTGAAGAALAGQQSLQAAEGWESIPETEAVTPASMETPAATTETDGATEALSGTETAEETAETEDPAVELIMVGDVLMHDRIIEAGKQADGTYSYDFLFEHTADLIEDADLALVNQETILGGGALRYSGYPAFNSPTEVGDAEVKAGFDVALHATNHALDRKAAGVENTLAFWKSTYPEMEVLGIHDSAEDQQELCILEIKGIRIAILNYTYGTNGISMPADKPYLVDYLTTDRVLADIARAEAEADFTVVIPHWGIEYKLEPSADQKKWAKLFLENGVDLVIGAHPHVIEPMEWMEDEKGHRMLVYYSLGNYVNATSGTGAGVMNRLVGGMADVELIREEDGTVVIESAGVIPLITHWEQGLYTTYVMEDYTEELAAVNTVRKQDASFSLEACRKLARDVWGEFIISEEEAHEGF
ncbi:MAG: CapA family protein [Lachnospiraceae bacterium]|nr:CapA family protein [Lachnospiraceae bacterium]